MGTPALNLDDLTAEDFEGGTDDPEVFELLDEPSDDADLAAPDDNSDLLDAPGEAEPENPAYRGVKSRGPGDFAAVGMSPEAIQQRLMDERPGPPGSMEPATAEPEQPAERHWWSPLAEMVGAGGSDAPGRMSRSEAFETGGRNPFELGDESIGVGSWAAALVNGSVPRSTGRGEMQALDQRGEYAVGRDIERGLQDKALADRPGDYRTGQLTQETIATAPSLIGAPIAMAARGATMAAPTLGNMMASNAAQSGALGWLTGAGASEANTVGDVVQDANKAGAVSGAVGAALPVAFKGVGMAAGAAGDALQAGSDALRSRANINRLAASGTYGAQLRNIAQNKGEATVQALGEDIERLGIHKGKPILGFIPNPFPQSPKTYAANSSRIIEDAGERMGAAEGAIAASGDPPINVGSIDADLRAQAGKHSAMFDPAGDTQAGFEKRIADRINAAGRPDTGIGPSTGKVPFSNALENRRYIDNQVDWTRKGGYEGAGMQEQVRRGVAGDMRAAIREGLDDAATAGQVDPATVAQWKQANADYSTAATVHEPALARIYQEYGNQKIGLPGWLAAISGATVGGAPGAVLAGAGGQLVKGRGAAALAGMQRAGQKTLGGLADHSPFNALAASADLAADVSQRSPWTAQRIAGVPQAAERIPFMQQPAHAQGDEWSALSQAGANARQQSAQVTQEREQAATQAAQNGTGQNLGEAVKTALKSNAPELAKYAGELSKAADAGSVELANALGRLEDSDPEFKRTVLPLLQQIANNDQRR